MICNICQRILIEDISKTGPFPVTISRGHHLTCRSLKSSVDLGCYICHHFWTTLEDDERELVPASAASKLAPSDSGVDALADKSASESGMNFFTLSSLEDARAYGRPGCYLLQLSFNAGAVPNLVVNPEAGFWRSVFVLQPCSVPEQTNVCNRLPQSTRSAETLRLARSWIETCVSEHKECEVGTEKRWYPTRLLDLGTVNRETCRLVETRNTAIDGPYMTLSHCWGTVDCLELTLDNHSQFQNGIPFATLPQLYEDAMYVTRRLGIRYLWIDSLCILQRGDGLADWYHEVALMDKVYSNTLCNISATDAPNAYHTMFHTRNPEIHYPQRVNVPSHGGGIISQFTIMSCHFWQAEVSGARLNRRAWVLQERLMAPRVLHFGRNQILWECRAKDAAETYPEGLPHALHGSSHIRFKDLRPATRHRQDPRNSDEDAYDGNQSSAMAAAYQPWTQIVRQYTASSLTFPGDKLVALSAVAKLMAGILRDEYIAGMWRRYLEPELLWSVCRSNREIAKRPEVYRAPSWSWASVDGEVNPGYLDVGAGDMLMKVEDVQLEYVTDDKTGLVRGGWLRLRGALKNLALLPRPSPSSRNSGVQDDWIMFVNGTQVSIESNSKMRELQPHVILDTAQQCRDLADPNQQQEDGDIYCMPARKREGDQGSIYVLILKVHNREKGMFRRIGLARGWGADVKQKIMAISTEESKFPCDSYQDGLHTIYII